MRIDLSYPRLAKRGILLLALLMLAFAGPVAAAQGTPKPVEDTPARVANRSATVALEHDGTDSVGARLALALKERFNTGSLFTLSDKDEPKIKVLLSTAPEFPARPNISSVYAVVWVFSQRESALSFTLQREVGVVEGENVEALAARIAEATDGIAVKYTYLYKN